MGSGSHTAVRHVLRQWEEGALRAAGRVEQGAHKALPLFCAVLCGHQHLLDVARPHPSPCNLAPYGGVPPANHLCMFLL